MSAALPSPQVSLAVLRALVSEARRVGVESIPVAALEAAIQRLEDRK